MKITIRNISAVNRSIPTPANTAIPIKANSEITFEYPKGFENFFTKLTNYGFTVKFDDTVKNEVVNPTTDTVVSNDEVKTNPVEDTTDTKEVTVSKDTKSIDQILKDIRNLDVSSLKEICSKLGINTTSSNVNTICNKIESSKATDDDIIKAYNDVVGD